MTVTDRGTPIAATTPANGCSKLDQLIPAGVVTPVPNRGPRAVPRTVTIEGTSSDPVAEQRR
jgi:hypothetical protein